MIRALWLVMVFALAAPVRADEPEKEKTGPPADELLAAGLAQAKNEDKRVFLIFGSPSCGWCRYLDKYHAVPEVKKLVGKHFVLVKVDVVANPGGEKMYKQYGTDRGVPAWTILAPNAKVLADSGDGRANVGFPYEDKEIEHYEKAVRAAAPKLSDADVELLVKELRAAGPARQKKDEKKDR
jgi:hypothetical protein